MTVSNVIIPSKRITLVTDICDKVIMDKHKTNDRDHSYIHPSSVAGCTRKIMYDHFSYTSPAPDTSSLRIFDNGHAVHQRLQSYFQSAKIQIADELVLNVPEFNISGRTDSLVKIDMEHLLVEIKSASAKSFKWEDLKNAPAQAHAFQLQLYMHLANRLYPEYKIKRGVILYECKDNQKWMEFETLFYPELWETIKARLQYINTLMYTKTLPSLEFTDGTKFPCSWGHGQCSYHGQCWN